LKRGIAFLSVSPDYGTRLARLRWVRAAGAGEVAIADWKPGDPAAAAVGEAESWVFVADAEALPLPVPRATAHTLRELESMPGDPGGLAEGAIEFRPADVPPADGETIKSYIRRLLSGTPDGYRVLPSFSLGDPSRNERPEVVERLPAGEGRILDLGCGSGGLGLARSRRPGWRLTGVEREPLRASRARETGVYERVVEGDIGRALSALADEGARFDAVVFADVLEHLEDPMETLSAARAVAAPEGMLLAVVPNAGHLSVVRDLLLGRHDPVPAGLCDAGHLRWFSKSFLGEVIEESGWSVETIEGIAGAPPPDAGPFLALARSWPEADLESLATYQWVATARASGVRREAVNP
jgi:SAM-dependent methyltransferase